MGEEVSMGRMVAEEEEECYLSGGPYTQWWGK